MTPTDEARAALLRHLAERFGPFHDDDQLRRDLDALIAAVRAESADTMASRAAWERDAVYWRERAAESGETLAALRDGVDAAVTIKLIAGDTDQKYTPNEVAVIVHEALTQQYDRLAATPTEEELDPELEAQLAEDRQADEAFEALGERMDAAGYDR